MTQALIVSTACTALAKSRKGAFDMTHGATLGGDVAKAAVERAGIDPGAVEDVRVGCANPEGATGSNFARQAALRAGLPVSVAGVTTNRFCSSGLQTIALAAQRIIAGEGDVYVAGGVESISCVQQEMNLHMFKDPELDAAKPEINWNMMQTAEQAAKRAGVSKERMDRLGAESQQKACAAQEKRLFDAEIAPITVTAGVADAVTGLRSRGVRGARNRAVHHRFCAVVLTTLLAASVGHASESSATVELPADIVALVRQEHCSTAVRLLRERLKSADIPTLLLAGVLHDIGGCVARDWSRAEVFFIQAANKGSRNAALQLAAGYASVQGGDVAAALWWAHIGNAPMPADCTLRGFDASMQPEAFVDALRGWGRTRVDACAYAAGVMAGAVADAFYPQRAARNSEQGVVRLTFSPAQGLFSASSEEGDVRGSDAHWRVGDPTTTKGDLISHVRNVTLRSAQRFKIPNAIPDAWSTTIIWRFQLQP